MNRQMQSFKAKLAAVVISPLLHPPRLLPVFVPTLSQRSAIPGWYNRPSIAGLVWLMVHPWSPSVESNLKPPSDTNAPVNIQHVLPCSDADSNIDPALVAESQMPAHALPSIAPRFSTPLQLPSGNVIKECAPEVMEPPLTVQPNIPIMRIIPPTPIDATSSLGAEDNVRTRQPSPGQSEPSTPTAGRRSAAINSILDEGYNSLEDILMQLVDKTALSLQQIMDGWHKSKGRIINGINHWNLYTKYIVKHEDQERWRLGLPADIFSMLINLFFHSLS